ncbi:MAG: DUF1211 domain-containing protein [Saprospirales bacterium]|nr:DUF1211 domain-containing protein [Saprospirales bacterium]
MNKNRIEAFSDGVIAIIITVMVFDLKIPEIAAGFSDQEAWGALLKLLPKLGAYIMSFVVLGIMWLNHHAMYDLIERSTSHLVWYNHHLLFWMSLIPLPTAFLAAHPLLPQACMFYGLVLGGNALGFTLLRWYAAVKRKLMPYHPRYHQSNILSTALYFSAAALAFVSVYLSYLIFIAIPVWYFLPDKLHQQVE